jgi:ATP-dependent Clp protease adaptor protein ClpS
MQTFRNDLPDPGRDHPSGPVGAPVLEPETEERNQLAPQYKVLIHNDPVTAMDFVIYVLLDIFRLDHETAVNVTIEAHSSGAALVGVYPLEQAEFLVDRAHAMARTAKFPLTFTYEADE